MNRFFILDCNGQIVGNKLGYATIRGAIRQSELEGSPASRAIWAAFHAKRAIDPAWQRLSKIAGYNALTDEVRGLIGSKVEQVAV